MNVSITPFGSAADWKNTLSRLMHRPGYAVAAWIMLGLAVAANTAAFAIVYSFIIKPLPYKQPERLSLIRERETKIGRNSNNSLVSVKDYLSLKKSLSGIIDAGLATQPDAEPVRLSGRTYFLKFEQVTPSLFRTLGVRPVLGRLPAKNADQPGGPPEVVIAHHLWRSAYHGRSDVLGRSLEANGRVYQIVGVMPAGFFYRAGGLDAWLPYVITPERADNSSNQNYSMVVRRGPNVSPKQLDLELENQRERLLESMRPDHRSRARADGFALDAQSIRADELRVFGIGDLPLLLQATAAILLLLALANTINLGMVRLYTHGHEFAMRRVLGATRGGLARLVLIEHLPIAVVVVTTAIVLAWAGLGEIGGYDLMPLLFPFHMKLYPAVVAFGSTVGILSVLAVAAGPATLASGGKLLAGIERGPTRTDGKGLRRIQRIFGAAQIALACALVVASGLLGISLARILSQPLGFQPQNRIEGVIFLPHGLKNSVAWSSLEPRLRELPNVSGVAAAGMTPFSRIGGDYNTVRRTGDAGAAGNVTVNMPSVSSGFFSTLGIELLAGRAFTTSEVKSHAPVVVINEWLAKHFFGSASKAVGRTLDMWLPVRVVGVTRGVAWKPTPSQYKRGTVYFPFGANQQDLVVAILKTSGQPAPLIPLFRRTVRSALPGSTVFRISTMPDLVRGASAFQAAGAGLVGMFAGLALLLAAFGVFAITAFIARARLGEFGIRAALGADSTTLLRLGVGEAACLLAVGLPIGLAGAYLLGRVIEGTLYETPVFDPGIYFTAIGVITAMVLVAAWGPARRAAYAPIRDLLREGCAR